MGLFGGGNSSSYSSTSNTSVVTDQRAGASDNAVALAPGAIYNNTPKEAFDLLRDGYGDLVHTLSDIAGRSFSLASGAQSAITQSQDTIAKLTTDRNTTEPAKLFQYALMAGVAVVALYAWGRK